MNKLSKNKLLLILSIGLVVTYLLTRLINITAFPIFTDEAIYIRWAQIGLNDPDWFFISLTDGKQPLFIWFTMVFLPFVTDPLLAGRLVSVVAGLFSMVGLFFLASELFKSKKIGFIAAFLYLIYPFALVYDRIALYDSLVAAFIVWALYIEILLVRRLHWKYALLLGIVIGLGLLNKTSANFALLLLPFSLLLFNFNQKKWKPKLLRWAIYAGVAALISQAIYALLRISPFYYIIAQKDATFIYPLNEWIQHPFTYILPNLTGLSTWLIGYMTIPLLFVVVVSLFLGKKHIREIILMVVWFIVPFIALAIFGKLLYPRYILFMTLPLLVLAAFSFYTILLRFKHQWLQAGILIVFMLPFIVTDYFIITNFDKAAIPESDKNQYYRGWPAGGGIKETVAILERESRDKKIFVGTEGTFGLLPYALEIYLHDNPNVTIKGFWPVDGKPPQEVVEASKVMPTYFVFYQQCGACPFKGEAPPTWPVQEVYQFTKAEVNTYHTLYKVQEQ